MIGLTEEEAIEANRADVWPDNVDSVNVFIAMSTQWIVDSGAAMGLNYGSIEPVLRLVKVPRKDWPEVFDDIRVMEDAALEQMRTQR